MLIDELIRFVLNQQQPIQEEERQKADNQSFGKKGTFIVAILATFSVHYQETTLTTKTKVSWIICNTGSLPPNKLQITQGNFQCLQELLQGTFSFPCIIGSLASIKILNSQ